MSMPSSSTQGRMGIPDRESDTKHEDPFTELEHQNWQRGVDAYTKGFGPLTSQAVPTLLDRAGFLVENEEAAAATTKDRNDIDHGVRLLDVACGPGQVVDAAIARVKQQQQQQQQQQPREGSSTIDCTYTALDFSARFLALAETNLGATHPDTPVEFVEGDAQNLPFGDHAFDAVTSNFGILHLSDPDSFLAESYRVLAPGGRLSFTAWSAPPATEAFAAILGAVASSGNPNVPLPNGPAFFRFADPSEVRRSLEAVGFVNTGATVVESMEWTNLDEGSADDLYQVFLEGTARTRELLKGQTEEETASVLADLQRRLDERLDGVDGTRSRRHLKMPAVVSWGRKPLGSGK